MADIASRGTPQRERRSCWSSLASNKLAVTGCIVLSAIGLVAAMAPILPLADPNVTNTAERLRPVFSEGHWLGTDALGRDMLSRLIWGTQTSLLVGALATLVAALVGSTIGLLAAYLAGWTDRILMRLIDVLMGFPSVLLALAIVAAVGPSLVNALYAIAIVNIPFFARNVRGVALEVCRRPFVAAARLTGKGRVAVLLTEVLPNVLPVIVITISTTIGWMIVETAGLSFLGLGAQPPQADLGSMLGEGRAVLLTAPGVSILPGLVIFLVVISANVLGDGIRDMLDPRLRSSAPGRARSATEVERGSDQRPHVGASTCLVEVERLGVGFRGERGVVQVVKDVSFRLERGECLGLIGESGSGKSVTALSLARLLTSPPGVILSGRVGLDGEDVLSLSETAMTGLRGQRISYVFQDPLTTLHPMLTVGTQIGEAVRAHRTMSGAEARRAAFDLMRKVGLQDPESRIDAHPHQLSGGQRQRVGIAMALANDPQVIVADEPTTALDVTVQAVILDLLSSLRRERDLALLLITHNFGVVARMCDRVAVMRGGEIVETGPTREVLENPKHAYTRRLLACVPELGDGPQFLTRLRSLFPEAAR